MSDINPPPDPGQESPKPIPTRKYYVSEPPSKKLCTALGGLLFIGTALLCFLFPPIFFVGLIVAIGSLFFEGYRCIFVGYVLTVGLLLLGVIMYCASHPLNI